MEVNIEVIYSKAEQKMCEAYARIAAPQEYRTIFDHICDVAKPYGNMHPEAWINKMIVKTISLYESYNKDMKASSMIEDVLHDAAIKHMNFK